MPSSLGTRSPRFEPVAPRTDFDRLLEEFRGLSDSTRMQGNYLEQLAKHYLEVEPQWADRIDEVWLWQDWPERGNKTDTGIDLVARMHDGGTMAIQVKFYAASHRIQKGDLDSFFEAMGREPFTEGLVIDTTEGHWSSNALEALKNRSKQVHTVSLDQLRHTAIDWTSYALQRPEIAPKRHELKQLRAHQHAAISKVMTAFETDAVNRGQLIMACGTGKTFTALKLAERWTRERADSRSLILFMVPSLALLQQTLEEWSREHDPELPLRAFVVGSDHEIGRKKTGDITSVRIDELGAPATTSGATLAKAVEHAGEFDDGMTVVFSTYHSIQAIHEAQQLGLEAFDLIICDEAHRTTGVTLTGEDDSHFVRIHDNDYVDGDRRVYMTATPRIFNDAVKNTASERDAELMSMDDESLFGQVLHRIGFGEAVDQGLLTDYKVIVLGVSEDQVIGELQQGLSQGGHEFQIDDVAKLVGCWNAMAKRNAGSLEAGFGEDLAPMRRAVAFAKDIATSKRIADDFQDLVSGQLRNLVNASTGDDLGVQCRHVDGTMGATERGELLDWLKDAPEKDAQGFPVARVLTNARCLSEGVDVPTLDAVLFLNARKSQVDVVQAVGRVMRTAPGKKCGYIVLPIAVPAGSSAESALGNNERYRVVWQVLQALRSHDERLDAKINQMAISGRAPETIVVSLMPSFRPDQGDAGDRIGGDDTVEYAWDGDSLESVAAEGDAPDRSDINASGSPSASAAPASAGSVSVALPGMQESVWKDVVHGKIVKNVGDKLYWDTWAKDISAIAQRFIALISAHLDAQGADAPESGGSGVGLSPFDAFVGSLRESVNPEIDHDQAIELVAQHMITMPIFAALFPEGSFSQANPVSAALEQVVADFSRNPAFTVAVEPLEEFYARVTARIRDLPDVRSRQTLLITLYDKFFSQAFPKLADRMGIVFTPVEVVDYILRSADEVTHAVFGKRLSDEGVNVIDPFTGTGTFITRLLQSGLIRPEDLNRKFARELFANEIVLLSYYIAAVNIESVYREVCTDQGIIADTADFPGVSLVDTFGLYERDYEVTEGAMRGNSERVQRQRDSQFQVIVMNPPYSVGQGSANGNNQNASYPALDEAIRAQYADRSSAQNKNGLYDAYYRALRWATDRIGNEGVIAFVSNSGFIDGGTAAGVRLAWQEEFSDIFVYNLRGNARTQGEARRKESGNIFGEGSRTGVVIAILVKIANHEGPARIHYCDIGDYLTREEKLDRLRSEAAVSGTEFVQITPNDAGDWINQRDERFAGFQSLSDPSTRGDRDSNAVFSLFSRGLATSRDAWCYNFSASSLASNMSRTISNAKSIADGVTEINPNDPTQVSWSVSLKRDVVRNQVAVWVESSVRPALYRPFTRSWAYFDRAWNDRVYRLPRLFPAPKHPNLVIMTNSDSRREAEPLITDLLPDLHVNGDTQCFSRYTWEPVESADGGFNLDALAGSDLTSDEVILDGYRRVDNITDHTLETYREVYADDCITKDDIFYGVYGLLHHPTYRELYAADLKKMLPRIPHVRGFTEYARIGRALADLHVNYEQAPRHALNEEWALDAPAAEFERYAIEKLTWTKRSERTGIRVNAFLTLTGIPPEADDYKIGGRSPLEWILDRYRIKVDKPSGIVNDPNAWLREQNNPRYVVDLIGSLVTLSLETQRLVAELPPFEVIEERNSAPAQGVLSSD